MWQRTLFFLMLLAAGGCQTGRATGPHRSAGQPERPADAAAREVALAYVDAALAHDREKIHSLVLLPGDPKRRQWVLNFIADAELPPKGGSRPPLTVTRDGPVAVCRSESRAADGSAEPTAPLLLVRRAGGWKVVVDFFEGGELTDEEMQVVERQMFGRR